MKDFKEEFDEVKYFLDKKNYEEALVSVEHILIHDNSSVDALKLKSFCLFKLKRYVQALKYYNRALAINDDDVDVKLYNEIFERAELEKQTVLFSNFNLEYYIDLLNRSISDVIVENSLDYLNKVLIIDPKNYKSLNDVAQLFYFGEEYEKSFILFEESLLIKKNYKALIGKGNSLFNILRNNMDSYLPDEFDELFFKIINIFDNAKKYDEKALLFKAKVYNEFDQLNSANMCYEEYLRDYSNSEKDYFKVLYKLGLNHFKLEKYSEAIETFDECLTLNNNSAEILFYRGKSYYELEEYQNAVNDFYRLLLMNPVDFDVLMLCSKSYIYLHNFEKALNCFDKSIENIDCGSKKELLLYALRFAKAELLANLHRYEESYNLLKDIPSEYFTKGEKKLFDYIYNQLNKDFTNTGMYAVSIIDFNDFNWAYSYFENGIFKRLYSKDIDDLRIKVLNKGLIWHIFNEKLSEDAIEMKKYVKYGIRKTDYIKIEGIVRENNNLWKFNYLKNDSPDFIQASNVDELKNKISDVDYPLFNDYLKMNFKEDVVDELQNEFTIGNKELICSLNMFRNYSKGFHEPITDFSIINPTCPMEWNDKGYSLACLDDELGALFCFSKAIELDDKNPIFWNNKGFIKLKLGNKYDAIVCFKQALKLDPVNPIYLSNRACVYKEFDAEYPDNPYFMYNKSCYLEDLGDYYLEEKYIDMVFNLGYMTSVLWYQLGNHYLWKNDTNHSLKCFNMSLKINPFNPDYLISKARTLFKLNKLKGALDLYIKAFSINGSKNTFNELKVVLKKCNYKKGVYVYNLSLNNGIVKVHYFNQNDEEVIIVKDFEDLNNIFESLLADD